VEARHPLLGPVTAVDLYRHTMPVCQPPKTASFIVYRLGDTYYAEDASKAQVEFSGADAAEVIQSAIDALDGMGGIVFLKRGTYDLAASIELDNYMSLRGEGGGPVGAFRFGTVLRVADGANITPVTADTKYNLEIRDLMIDGNKANQTAEADGIYFYRVTCGNVVNVKVHDVLGEGIVLYYYNYYNTLRLVHVWDCTSNGIRCTTNPDLIEVDGCRVTNCLNALWLAGNPLLAVRGCYLSGSEEHGIMSDGGANRIVNNTLVNIGKKADNTYNAINIVDTVDAIATNNVIKNPDIAERMMYGIREAGTSDYNIIANNIVKDWATAAITTVGVNTITPDNVT